MRHMLWWPLAALVLMGQAPANAPAQPPSDVPDNMDVFEEVPVGDNTPYTQWGEPVEEPATAQPGGAEAGEVPSGLVGTLVDIEPDRLWLQQESTVLPVTVDAQTRFGAGGRQALEEGQQVRAEYTVDADGVYVATSVEPVRPKAPERGGPER